MSSVSEVLKMCSVTEIATPPFRIIPSSKQVLFRDAECLMNYEQHGFQLKFKMDGGEVAYHTCSMYHSATDQTFTKIGFILRHHSVQESDYPEKLALTPIFPNTVETVLEMQQICCCMNFVNVKYRDLVKEKKNLPQPEMTGWSVNVLTPGISTILVRTHRPFKKSETFVLDELLREQGDLVLEMKFGWTWIPLNQQDLPKCGVTFAIRGTKDKGLKIDAISRNENRYKRKVEQVAWKEYAELLESSLSEDVLEKLRSSRPKLT